MRSARFIQALSAVALFNALLYFSLGPTVAWASNEDDAKKYTMDLKRAKDAKTKVTALNELGKLAAIQKKLVADALPDIYKALENKDASIRAAAAKCLGACDEPTDKALPLLVKLLNNDKDDAVKIGAINGIASMGPNAKSASKDLRALSKEKSKVGKAAKNALKAINQKN